MSLSTLPTIIVDDQDARIQRSGLWSLGGTETDYGQTASSSRASNASITFPFSGTSVSLVGSYFVGGTCNATVSLDGHIQATFQSPNVSQPMSQSTIWSSSDIQDGSHTVQLFMDECEPRDTETMYLWLDYILYTPSATTLDSTNGLKYFIDDTDPSLSFSGTWTAGGGDNYFNHTATGGKKGDSMKFSFQGTAVTIYGSVQNSTSVTQASFRIDNSDAVIFSAVPQPSASLNQILYHSGRISGEIEHTLVINVESDERLWIDYLIVNPGSSSNATPSSSQDEENQGLGVGAIVGVVAGCTALFALIALSGLLWRRWRRKRRKNPLSKRTGDLDLTGNTIMYAPRLYPPRPPTPPRPDVTLLSNKKADVSRQTSTTSYVSSTDTNTTSTPTHSHSRSFGSSTTHRRRPLPSTPSTRSRSVTYTAPSLTSESSTTALLRSVTALDEHPDPDSVEELKKRQQQVVVLSQEGVSVSSHDQYQQQRMQMMDSGLRIDLDDTGRMERFQAPMDDDIPLYSPPQYTPRI